MKTLDISQNVVKWTNDFISNRRVTLAFDNERDDMKAIETDILQSSPVSPILFLIYLRPLFDKIKK